MCRVLKISRSTYYYKPVKKENTDILEQTIKKYSKIVEIIMGLER